MELWNKEKEIELINQTQDDYIKELKEKILSDNIDDEVFKEINFTSPTGTGKTNMMAKLINIMPDYFFVITTLSKGQLYKQIEESIKNNVKGDNYIVYGSQSYKKNSILQDDDILSRLPSDKKVIWLRDEGHINTSNWSLLLTEKCYKIINFSATNKRKNGIVCNFIHTAMLRTVNQNSGSIKDALDKLKEIKEQHKKVKGYNPCAIFRVVHSSTEKEIIKTCEEYGFKHITLIDNSDFSMQEICDDDNEYDVVINKQKIVEGIDIRRAHIIWLENQPNNPSTTIQLIGRCRRNALLWRKDIDILAPENKKLLENTRQCYVFYNQEMRIDTDENGELAIAFCPYISVENLKTGYEIYVDNGVLPNGLIVAELIGCTGYYLISKDEKTGFNVVKNKEYYKLMTSLNISQTMEGNKLKPELYKKITNNRELALLGSDLYQQIKGINSIIWKENRSVTEHLNNNCKFNRFIENKFNKELENAEPLLFSGKNNFGFSPKLNSCVGYCVEYYAKYLAYGKNYLKGYIDKAKKECSDCDENKIIVRACALKYRNLMKQTYGSNVRLKTPSVKELMETKGFNEIIIELGTTAAEFIKKHIKTKTATKLSHSFITSHFSGLADVMDDETIIDIKCTSKIDRTMLKQVLAYYYLSSFRFDVNIKRVIVYEAVTGKSITITLPEIEKDNSFTYKEENKVVAGENGTYETEDYIYTYDEKLYGYRAVVKDKTKTKYEPLLPEIDGIPLISLKNTFEGCKNLIEALKIPESVINMFGTFSGCTSLKTAPTIPNNVTNMSYIFSDCTSLTTAPVIPNSVISMEGTFLHCSSLTKAPKIPNGVKYIDSTFSWCISLTQAPIIPNNVKSMALTFYGCRSLTKAPVIPNNVTNMYATFQGCFSLTEAPVIPESVESLSDTFIGCNSLTEPPEIPNGVTNMEGTFCYCTSLIKPPIIPEGVRNMERTFEGCILLIEAPKIPDSVRNMKGTFQDCKSLSIVPKIPEKVKDISYIFNGCESLTEAPVIPEKVKDMSWAFKGCKSLTGEIEINANPKEYYECFERVNINNVSFTGVSNELDEIKATCRTNKKYTDYLTFEEQVESNFETKDYIYSYDKDLDGYRASVKDKTKTKYEPLLTKINDKALVSLECTFGGCEFLTKAPKIPSSVKNMFYTFGSCTSLTKVPKLPKRVRDMEGTFSGCSSLTDAPEIPDSVRDMDSTFGNCISLKTAPVIPESVTDMWGTFKGCSSLTGNIEINANLESYGKCFEGVDTSKITLIGTSNELNKIKTIFFS